MNFVPFIIGPTGIGKTEISVQIAKKLPIEIISADSRQIYKFMDIGTAKPPPEILKIIPHHFINHLSPNEYFSAGMYGKEARNKINQILDIKKIPLVVGGSGLYIQALIDGFSEINVIDQHIRDSLHKRLTIQGVEKLHTELESVDPALAKKLKMKDKQRILRGLEVFYATGIPLSQLQLNKPDPASFNPVMIGLEADRDFLYNKINNRVDEMMKKGLVDEVRQLKDMGFSGEDNALNTVGYKEIINYLRNTYELGELVDKIKINSRRYAKRQITWFRRDDRIEWLKINEFDRLEYVVEQIVDIFKKFNIK